MQFNNFKFQFFNPNYIKDIVVTTPIFRVTSSLVQFTASGQTVVTTSISRVTSNAKLFGTHRLNVVTTSISKVTSNL